MYLPLADSIGSDPQQEWLQPADDSDGSRSERHQISATTVENYMNERYYQDNDSFEISAMSMESIVESMTSMLSTVSLGHRSHLRAFLCW